MQTFLPYPDFIESAAVLDMQRLGKQRVECLQIVNALTVEGHGWSRHPAVRMWRGHLRHLLFYMEAMIDEWVDRGYKNTMRPPWSLVGSRSLIASPDEAPSWLGYPAFHRSHRSNLLRKNRAHYSKYWNEPDDLPYVWPTG